MPYLAVRYIVQIIAIFVYLVFFKLPSQYLTFGRPAIYISRRCIFEETAAKDFSHVFGHRAAEFCTLWVRVHKNMFFFPTTTKYNAAQSRI